MAGGWPAAKRCSAAALVALAVTARGSAVVDTVATSARQDLSAAEAWEEATEVVPSLQSTFSTWLDGLQRHWRDLEHGGLKHWLESLQVKIPAQSKTLAGFAVELNDGLCNGIDLDRIHTQENQNDGLQILVSGVRVNCTLNWTVTNTLLPLLDNKGAVVAKVANATVGGTAKLVPDQEAIPFPQGLIVSDCQADLAVSDLQITDAVLPGVADFLLRDLVKFVVNRELSAIVCDKGFAAAATLGNQTLGMANEAFRRFMATGSVTPQAPELLPSPTSDFADFQDNPGMKLLSQLLNGALGNNTSPWSLNSLVNQSLGPKGQLSAAEMGLLPLSFPVEVSDLGRLNITVEALVVEGLNRWTSLELKRPGPRQLGLGLGMEGLQGVATVRLDVRPNAGGPLSGQTLSETFDMGFGLSGFNTSSSAFMAINTTSFGNKAFDQLPNLGCLAESAQQILLQQSGFVLGSLNLNLVPRAGPLEHDVDRMINLLMGYTLTELQIAISSGLNHAVSVVLRDFVNNQTEKLLGSPPSCPAPATNYSMPLLAATGRQLAFTLACTALVCFVVCGLRDKRTDARTVLKSLTHSLSFASTASGAPSRSSSTATLPAAADARLSSLSLEAAVPRHQHWDCLAYHPKTWPALRYSLPCCVVATICVFLWSNGSLGTSIMVSLKADGQDVISLPPVKDFTLGGTLKDMLDAKVYPLALLIAFFSGFWPYIKLLMMLVCWFSPPSILSVHRRQTILDLLDAFGKWSLIDMFVMVMFMVAFQFNLSATDNPLKILEDLFNSSGSTGSFIVYVQPLVGFHMFLFATLSSLCLGHIMTSCHRKALQICEFAPFTAMYSRRRTRLCNVLRPPGPAGRVFTYVPVVLLVATQVLVSVGIFLDSFAFTFQGLSGLVLGDDRRTRAFSVLSLALQMPYSNPEPNSFATRWIQVAFMIFTMTVTVAYPLVLNCLWCLPLTAKVQRRLFTACQVMNAWSALDCFVVAIMAGVLEIEQFALNIVGNMCDPINAALAKSPFLMEKMHGKATCFDVQTELCTGYWLLLSSVVLAYVSNTMVLSRCSMSLCDLRSADGRTMRYEPEPESLSSDVLRVQY